MHEHMDQFKLINMNGRVYDPVLAQFLSPDPFVTEAGSTMSYNRYAYCNYNPLKYVDPSGYQKTNRYLEPVVIVNAWPMDIRRFAQDLMARMQPFGASNPRASLGAAFRSGRTYVSNGSGGGHWVKNSTINEWIANGDLVNLMHDGQWNIETLRSLEGFNIIDYSASDCNGYIIQTDNVWLALAQNSYSNMSIGIQNNGTASYVYNAQFPSGQRGNEGYFPNTLYSRDANKGDVYVSNKDVIDVFSQSVQPVAGTVSIWGVAIYELIAGSASKIPNGASAPILAIQITLQIEDWTRNAILRDYNANGGGQGMFMNYRESIQDMNGYLHIARSMTLIDAVNGRNYGTFNQNYLPRK